MTPDLVPRVLGKLLIPFVVLFALYVQFHGDFGPGGGFQAGVIIAASVIFYAIIFGLPAARRFAPDWLIESMVAAGVLIYGGVGVVGLLLGGQYLDCSPGRRAVSPEPLLLAALFIPVLGALAIAACHRWPDLRETSGLAFFLMLPMLRRTLTITLDVDWLYRRAGPDIVRVCADGLSRGLETLGAEARDWRAALLRWARLLRGPDEALARTLPTGAMALWICVLLAVYLVMYYV